MAANEKSVLINFSLSPIHFETKVLALILKNVHLHSVATAFASIVFPLPGGPYKRIPFVGALIPVKISGLNYGYTIFSKRACLTSVKPSISSHLTPGPLSNIVSIIVSTIFLSSFAIEAFL